MSGSQPGSQTRSRTITATVRELRTSVNQRRFLWSVVAASSGVGLVTCIIAGVFALSGQGVPMHLYTGALLLLIASVIVVWISVRSDDTQIARAVDERFGLQDGVRTAYVFESRASTNGFDELQSRWTLEHLESVTPQRLMDPISKRLIASAVALPVAAILLGFAPVSQEVIDERARREATIALAQDLNEGIEEMVEEEIAGADDEEQETLDPESLREMVDKLEVSPEEADLLRQYAEMEQELARRADKLESRPLETLLAEAAQQLAGSPQTSELSEALEQRRLNDAADELESFKLSDRVSAESLEQRKHEIEKLKSLAKRLAEAARKQGAQRSQSASKGSSKNKRDEPGKNGSSKGKEGKQGKGTQAGSSNSSGEMTDQDLDDASSLTDEIRELEEAVEELEESLRECKNGQCSESDLKKLGACTSRANDSLDRMSKTVRRAGTKQKSRERLRRMSQKLSQCQSCAAGQCQNPFSGMKPGSGTAESERTGNEREDGLQTDLTASTKSGGPALTSIEEAQSGDGVSGTRGRATKQEFSRQLESFIERPDVPAEVKEGVKLYLENIHATPEDEGDSGPSEPSPSENTED